MRFLSFSPSLSLFLGNKDIKPTAQNSHVYKTLSLLKWYRIMIISWVVFRQHVFVPNNEKGAKIRKNISTRRACRGRQSLNRDWDMPCSITFSRSEIISKDVGGVYNLIRVSTRRDFVIVSSFALDNIRRNKICRAYTFSWNFSHFCNTRVTPMIAGLASRFFALSNFSRLNLKKKPPYRAPMILSKTKTAPLIRARPKETADSTQNHVSLLASRPL